MGVPSSQINRLLQFQGFGTRRRILLSAREHLGDHNGPRSKFPVSELKSSDSTVVATYIARRVRKLASILCSSNGKMFAERSGSWMVCYENRCIQHILSFPKRAANFKLLYKISLSPIQFLEISQRMLKHIAFKQLV